MSLLKALLIQIVAGFVVFVINSYLVKGYLNLWFLIFFQAIVSASFSFLLRQASWWWLINLLFLPSLLLMMAINLPAWLYFVVFVLLVLVFWGTVKGDVPLFLSSSGVADEILALVKRENAGNFVDIGAGVGTVILPIAQHLPCLHVVGLERAPIPWLIAFCRCRQYTNVDVRLGSLWDADLTEYAVVFAFLSPLVMVRVGEKIIREMQAGRLFISAEFPVPLWSPEFVVEIADSRKTRLYCYRIPKSLNTLTTQNFVHS
ncbi:class I SAM-dependent methyltransferase [Methylomonas sp. AM2-LC]|uniref:class I SAM-dependent methyltransferase n=1 Tax=Methylomonas sp. AM2-LC TaxID=3153301 RepID=UPI0032639E3E